MPRKSVDGQNIGNRLLERLNLRRRHTRRRLVALAEDASSCAAGANALIAETEADFLALASDLKDLYTCATELGRSVDQQVTSLRDTISETHLIGSGGLAGVLLDGLKVAIAEMDTELAALNRICAELVRLVNLGDRISLTAIFLNTARYSFRVESARTEATRQSFGAFSEEMEPLANHVGAVGEAISAGARSAHSELGGLIRGIGKDSERLQEVIAATGTAVEQTCRRGQELLDASFTELAESAKLARQREHHAGEAIYHVQFGDIVRQKVEHIAAALEEAAAALRKADSELGHADHVFAIQHGQIDLITSEIRSVQQGLQSAFNGLGDETAALAASLNHPGESAVFEELKERLRELGNLEARGSEMRSQSRASWQRALETSREGSRQMEHLREINFRMHIQSLNAIIKTEWLGEQGVTLGVLSSHMHRVFEESNALVVETASVLETISNQTTNPADTECGHGGGEDADLDISLHAGLQAVSRVQEEFQRTVHAAQEMAIRQSSQLERARRSLDFLETIAGRLEKLGAEIGRLSEISAPLLHNAPDAASDPHSLANRYTMESEREVHRRHTAEAEQELQTAATGESGSELGDNVDFF